MNKAVGEINIRFGWCWLFIGIICAMCMGLYAFSPQWLGGYASLSRRLLRLGHVASMALPLTNILYGLCIPLTNIPRILKQTGSYSMIIAAIAMPTVCLLCTFNSFFQCLFFIPALSFVYAIFVIALGHIKKI